MTVSPREQYLYGRSRVEVGFRREHHPVRGSAPTAGELGVHVPHADLRQAEYYQDLLEDLRSAVRDELAHHRGSLAVREARGDPTGVRRSQRIIRVKESELAAIDRLIDALRSRFPTTRTDCHQPDSRADIVAAATVSGDL